MRFPSCIRVKLAVKAYRLKGPGENTEGHIFHSDVCSTGEEANKKAVDVFTKLSRDLRQLRDLPLSINSLQGTSPTFRYTEVMHMYKQALIIGMVIC